MDDIVYVVAPSLRAGHFFLRTNEIPMPRAVIVLKDLDLYGRKFGKFVYMLHGIQSPMLEHEVKWRAKTYGATVIECDAADVVERTWR